MREVVFRGKAINSRFRDMDGEWVYGSLFVWPDGDYSSIIVGGGVVSEYEVDPETVQQYTYHIDSNGHRIWEGDLVKRSVSIIAGVKDRVGAVEWDDGRKEFIIKCDDECFELNQETSRLMNNLTVLGNILNKGEN